MGSRERTYFPKKIRINLVLGISMEDLLPFNSWLPAIVPISAFTIVQFPLCVGEFSDCIRMGFTMQILLPTLDPHTNSKDISKCLVISLHFLITLRSAMMTEFLFTREKWIPKNVALLWSPVLSQA